MARRCGLDFGNRAMDFKGESLFMQKTKLYVKSLDRDDCERVVLVIIDLLPGSTPVDEKAVFLKVTDEEDPLFFYGVVVNEEEFNILKVKQNLLIEFRKFPDQLIRLLKLCGGSSEDQKFLLLLEQENIGSVLQRPEAFLKFVENNHFKQLCHLSLKVDNPTNEEIKEYMALKIKQLKASNETLSKKIAKLEAELSRALSDLDLTNKRQDEMSKQWAEEKNALEMAHVREMTNERERLADAKLLWQKVEEERKAKEHKEFHDMIRKLETDLTSTKLLHDETREKLSAAKEKNIKLSNQLATVSAELDTLKHDLPSLKKQNLVLDSDYHEIEKQLSAIKAENTSLKEEIKEKHAELSSQIIETKSLKTRKVELERMLDGLSKERDKLKLVNGELEDDVMKANSIILTYHTKVQDLKRQEAMKLAAMDEQAQLLEKKEKYYSRVMKESAEKDKQLNELQDSMKDLQEKLAQVNCQLSERDEELANNRNLIAWLNRKLTEAHMGTPSGPLTASTPFQGFAESAPPIQNPCWQSLRPQWWTNPSVGARLPAVYMDTKTPRAGEEISTNTHNYLLRPPVTIAETEIPQSGEGIAANILKCAVVPDAEGLKENEKRATVQFESNMTKQDDHQKNKSDYDTGRVLRENQKTAGDQFQSRLSKKNDNQIDKSKRDCVPLVDGVSSVAHGTEKIIISNGSHKTIPESKTKPHGDYNPERNVHGHHGTSRGSPHVEYHSTARCGRGFRRGRYTPAFPRNPKGDHQSKSDLEDGKNRSEIPGSSYFPGTE